MMGIKIPEVGKVKIRNFGIIRNAEIEFSAGLNIITGKNATGKSTVIKYLTQGFSQENLSSGEKLIFQIEELINGSAILMDIELQGLGDKNLVKILNKMAYSGRQVILTLDKSHVDRIKHKVKAYIIDTSGFKLENGREE